MKQKTFSSRSYLIASFFLAAALTAEEIFINLRFYDFEASLWQHETPGIVKGLLYITLTIIMLFAGVRRGNDGYYLPQEVLKNQPLTRDSQALRSFSRLSWDMQADSLCYAVLADAEIWGRDLRELSFLPDRLTEAVTDIQLLGLRQALSEDRE